MEKWRGSQKRKKNKKTYSIISKVDPKKSPSKFGAKKEKKRKKNILLYLK